MLKGIPRAVLFRAKNTCHRQKLQKNYSHLDALLRKGKTTESSSKYDVDGDVVTRCCITTEIIPSTIELISCR